MKKIIIALSIMLMASVSFAGSAFEGSVWIDVRTAEEHAANNISGDIRITHTDIVTEVQKLYPDKNTQIQLYCRSGGRAGKAMSALKEAGYSNVVNAGSIDDARKTRGLKP